MGTGEDFVRKIKPIGCVIFLLIFAAFMVMCFTANAPVKGYAVPHDSEYYETHLDELKTELEANLFPHLEGIEDCYVSDSELCVIIDDEHFEESSEAILHYYSENLFNIEKSD